MAFGEIPIQPISENPLFGGPVQTSQSTNSIDHSITNRDPGARSFYYPEGLGRPPFDKWIFFEARSGRHVVRDQVINELNGADRTLSSVGLYLSETALKNTLNVVYETAALGPFAGAIVELFAQSGRNLMDTIMTVGNDWAGTLKQALTNPGAAAAEAAAGIGSVAGQVVDIATRVSSLPMGDIIGADVLKGVNNLSNGAGSAVFGKRPNPRTDVLFDTQNYREYEMTFLLVPRNVREAQMIDNIVRFFQFYMLPKYDTVDPASKVGAFMLGFPYEFEISIRDGNAQELDHVNKFERSVLQNVMVDHAAGGKTAFVKDDNGTFWPVATQITLSFKEVRLLDRNSPAILRVSGNGSLPTGAAGPTQPLFPDPRT
jgi:hypothetical protein